jgi:hypothetical protein
MASFADIHGSVVDHLIDSFGKPVDENDFRGMEDNRKIKILTFDKVFKGCNFYCSLGLNYYHQVLREICEVFILADRAVHGLEYLLASSLFYLVKYEYYMRPGVAISSIEKIDESFYSRTGKSAIYFGLPEWLPEQKTNFKVNHEVARLYAAIFITEKEYQFLSTNGPDALEDIFEQRQVDVIDVFRPCALSLS